MPFLLAALLWQEPVQESLWQVWSDARPEQRTESARQDGDWLLPPIPAEGTARFAEPVSRADAAVEFEFAFTLGEDAPTSWALTLEHPDGTREVPLLQVRVDFDPIGGAVWTAAVRDEEGRARSFTLEEPPEPEGLKHHLKLRLPAEGGVDLRFADGHPLFVTSLGTLPRARLTLQRRGPVTDLRMRGPDQGQSLVSAGIVVASRMRAPEQRRAGFPPALLPAAGEAPRSADLKGLLSFQAPEAPEVRAIDPVTHEGVTVVRKVLTLRPRVEIPVLQFEPVNNADGPPPGVLLLPPRFGAGKLDSWALDLAMHLAVRGCRVLVPDEIAQGERREFQPHDGPYHRELDLVGGRIAGLLLEEAWAFLDTLRAEDPEAPLVLIGGEGTRQTALVLAALRDDLAGLGLPPSTDPVASPGGMPADLAAALPSLGSLPLANDRVLESADASEIQARLVEWFAPLKRSGPLPAPPAEEALRFGPLQVGSLWYSWILDEALRQHEQRPPVTRSVGELIEELLRTPAVPVSLERSSRGSVMVFDWKDWPSLVGVGVDTYQKLPAQAPLAVQPITVVIGEVGKVEALDRVAAVVPAREGELWISVDIPGLEPGRGDCAEWMNRSSWNGRPLLGLLVAEYSGLLDEIVRAGKGHPVRLAGQGVGGLLVLLVACLHPDQVESVVLVECMPSLSMLLEGDPRTRSTGPAGPVRSQAPSSLWYTPDLLATLDIEDLVLALMDQGVDVRMERPVDRQLRPLSRRDRNALWPRVLHRRWKDAPPAPDDG